MNVPRWNDYQRIAKAFARGQYPDKEDFIQDVIVELEKIDREKNYAATRNELLRAATKIKTRLYRARKRDKKFVRFDNHNDGSNELDIPTIELEYGMYTDDFEENTVAKLDAEAILENLPERLRKVGQKSVDKDTLTGDERAYLFRQRKKLKIPKERRAK